MSRLAIRVDTEPAYTVQVGPGLLADVAASVASHSRTAVLADERALELHGARLAGLDDAPCLVLPRGEAAKSLAQLERALEFLARSELDRRSAVVAFGGGASGDLAGLAAALFKRGIDVVQVPTTLLAQVDASVGGKTAVNLSAGKNLAGCVHQPIAVLADTTTLATLPEEEWRSGLGEVVKTALVGGERELALVEHSRAALLARDAAATAQVVAACVRVKAGIVAADPLERGPRRALNLGHTFAHAIEHAAGFGRIPHGVAVAVGLGLALEASRRAAVLEDEGLPARVAALLAGLGHPAGLDELRAPGCELAPAALLAGLRQDKKGAVGKPELVLLAGVGEVRVGVRVEEGLVRGVVGG